VKDLWSGKSLDAYIENEFRSRDENKKINEFTALMSKGVESIGGNPNYEGAVNTGDDAPNIEIVNERN